MLNVTLQIMHLHVIVSQALQEIHQKVVENRLYVCLIIVFLKVIQKRRDLLQNKTFLQNTFLLKTPANHLHVVHTVFVVK